MRTHEAESLHICQEVLEALNSMVMDVGPSSHPPGDVIWMLRGFEILLFHQGDTGDFLFVTESSHPCLAETTASIALHSQRAGLDMDHQKKSTELRFV